MKNRLISISACAIMLATATGASAEGTLDVRGTVYNVDTIFHAKVGPGTTQTRLRLSGAPNALDVFYLTIDKSTPGVSIRSVCARDKVAGTARTSAMAESKTRPGLTYFCGVNADFFTTSGNATNGSSKVGSPTTSCTVDREIYKTSNSQYQFSVDTEGIGRICRLNYYTGTATIGEKVTLFKGVNVGSPNNGITIYTPRYWGSANQNDYAGSCRQVTAKLAEGSEPFYAGGKFRLVVTGTPASDGDMAIPDDGYVIHGRGTSKTGCNTGALDFVDALKPGDIVEFNNIILTPEGESIHPVTIVSGNPKNVGGGETLDTESERGDASARHPRTNIGISADGNKIIMMVIDGRSGSSAGVATSMAADIMRYAGAYESVNLDGGGSSTLYTSALGVRNHCSDGSERAVGNAVFAVLEAPEDDEIVEIQFADFKKTVPSYGLYKPTIYGYNKYGKLVDTDVKGYTLTSEAGTPTADGTGIIASNPGTHALHATLGEAKASIVLTVKELADIEPVHAAVLLNTTRKWQIELQSDVDGEKMPVAAESFSWTSDNTDAVTVDGTGTVSGIAEGSAVLTGVNGALTCQVAVTVEVAKSTYMPLVPDAANPWRTTGSGARNIVLTPLERGAEVAYTISSARASRINIYPDACLYSLPEAVRLRVDTGNSTIKSLSVGIKLGNAGRDVNVSRTPDFSDGTVKDFVFEVSEFGNPDNIGIYPLNLYRISADLSGNTTTQYRLGLPLIEARYAKGTEGVSNIAADNDSEAPAVYYDLRGLRVDPAKALPGVYVRRQGRHADKVVIK